MAHAPARLRNVVSILVLVALGFLLWLFWPKMASSGLDAGDATPSVVAAPVAIGVAVVTVGDLSVTAEATGYLEAWRRVEIRTEVPGRVVELRVQESSPVTVGGLLLALDDRQSKLDLAEAEADWLKVKAQFAVDYLRGDDSNADPLSSARATEAEEAYRRAQARFDQGVISREVLEMARRHRESASLLLGDQRQNVQVATSGLLQAEHRVERLRLLLDLHRITAPFAGRIADLVVEVGEQVNAGEACMTLLDDVRMKVEVEVLESDFVHLRPRTTAWIRVPSLSEERIEGRVLTINPQVDPETGTGQVTVEIANPDRRLVPGLFGYVDLETRRLQGVVLVPAKAVLERQGRKLVFRVVDGRALWTYIETGASSRDLVEVEDGLSAGDRVAVAGHFALAHEAPVMVESAAAAAPTAPGGD